MGKMFRNLLAILLVLALNSQILVGISSAKTNPNSYTVYKTVYKNSFNEYRYLITKEFFKIKSKWDVDGVLDYTSLVKLKNLTNKGFNYLPDNNLENENLLNNLNTAIAKALKYNSSDAAYIGLIKAIWAYLDKSAIKAITWDVVWLPSSGNAPFNVTLRANVTDPTWTTIPKYNYVWWMDLGSRKVNIGTGPSINYTFREEWNFTVFVDIKSAHKNGKWYTDVIPYRGKVIVKVKEKIASLIVKVNGDRLWNREELKFTPSQAKYGLLFDVTSSVPTGSAKFTRTEWDFGNWIKKSYSKEPKVERVVYTREWDYDVTLKLKTNLWKEIIKEFVVSIHDPIATIDVSPKEWFLGDKFTFRAKNTTNDNNLTYNWQIVDIISDEIVHSQQTKLFTYNFKNKWHFNVRLEVSGIDYGDRNIDTKNIYINSRAPVADFKYSVPETNKPNRVLLDATDSFDPDFTDTGKLKYSWEIDWARVNLENTDSKGSIGYYTFDSIWDHNVVLKIEDPDNIEWVKKDKVDIKSILSVDFSTNPRAIKRWGSIKFEATSPEAKFFEWDFWDWNRSTGWVEEKITHKYEKTGIFNVKLKVIDESWKTNFQTKVVYVWNWEKPVAILNVWNNSNGNSYEKNACKGQDAYITDRITSISFDAWESINIDWMTNNLDYSLKVWASKYFTNRNVTYKFDEIGCFPVILKVTSKTNHSTDIKKIWVKVKNIEPSLSKLVAKTDSLDTEPVIVTVEAIWALDKDWVITSYLWYYYTDLDDEPQDFRSTTGPSTKFVLPKITWNYYFVSLLTDDSQARVSSKDLWKSASLTLAWNNVNVPILEFKTPDNSVHVWDEVIFNAKVQNILKQNISKKVQYFWDFDWDWFYDLETKIPNVTYSYDKPGTFYAKLKVKHKGFSNTRNIEINVANSLVPKFDYVSVWNKFIFVNKTTWTYENFSFDLGDWTKIDNKDYFEHNYTDGKSSHIVKLIASDWNTVKNIEKKVVKNIKNLFKSKNSTSWILLVTPAEDSENNIVLEKRVSNITVLFIWNKKDFSEIGADIDLEKDTDLNGWKDDDNNIISTEEWYLNIELNTNKVQTIRVFVKDSDSKVIISKDYTITKKYIKDEDINLDKVVFEWASNSQKQKLEELKDLVSSISWDDSRSAKTYVARLKDEWSDENERTKIIYEFEGFLEGTTIQNKNEIIEKLEELLLKESDDNNLKNIALRALQGLTPKSVECEFDKTEYNSCKNYIDSSLEIIKFNDDIEQNKVLWGSILKIIWADKTLSTEQKMSYKATLQNLIYGDVSNIPEENKDIVIDDSEDSFIGSIFKTILYIILSIVWLFILWGLIYFIYYKFYGKTWNKDFKEFIEEKTDSKKDVLSDKKEEVLEEKDDIFSPDKKEEVKGNIGEKIEKESIKSTSKDEVPDWLKGNFEESSKKEIKPKEDKKEEPQKQMIKDKRVVKSEEVVIEKKVKKQENLDKITKIEDNNVPDWLKGSIEETPKKEENKPKIEDKKIEKSKEKEIKKEEPQKQVKEEIKKQEVKVENKLKVKKSDNNIPDWLKWSLEEKPKKEQQKKEDFKEEVKEEIKKQEVKVEDKPKVKKSDDDIPDWLKWSFDEEKNEEIKPRVVEKNLDETKKESPKVVDKKNKDVTIEKIETKVKDNNTGWKKEVFKEQIVKKETPKKVDIKKPQVKTEVKNIEAKNSTTIKENKPKTENKKDVKKKKDSSDLWDDGMDVPDWLKN